MPKPTNSTTKPSPHPHSDESIKETVESIVIAFILAFIFRAYVVEAFIIPTGSMAPTLLGQHIQINCSQCGYSFPVDNTPGAYTSPPPAILCPMCRFPNAYNGLPIRNGDRILVQKYTYLFNEPSRWDVVVFKTPIAFNNDRTPGPTNNFIKRLVGLPNESIRILDGNIYTQPLDPQTNQPLSPDFKIARKSTNPEAQQAVLRPIYHAQYIPLDQGRISSTPGNIGQSRNILIGMSYHQFPWQTPWTPTNSTDAFNWQIDNQRSYTYSPKTSSPSPSTITFDFARGHEHNRLAMYPYNELKDRSDLEPIEDINLALTINPKTPNTAISLSTTARWDDPDPAALPYILTATITAEGNALLTATNQSTNKTTTLDVIPFPTLPPDTNTELQLRYIDQELSFWVNDSQILSHAYDLPLDFLANRRAPDPTPTISITLDKPATLHNVNLDRDLYYAPRPTNGLLGHGAMIRTQDFPDQVPTGPVTRAQPFNIGPDEFFCLGDNSPSSSDSRAWQDVDAWISKNYFNSTDKIGVVPGELMLGRAFFVYFPAPYGYIPNFGDMRFIH
ncbi:signal peptidase I [Poriferisphaera corsica]|uniref:Signal peptidase I n=1 Tax=Poriferisphaera corsica TaxID=2528020 RepID=A0A517YVX6_9BACT|nr:S26 family signal peptidase [Poriferisphaera corsica]QDU34381.1 signal peptidase I [Poriferisphaera corsica]